MLLLWKFWKSLWTNQKLGFYETKGYLYFLFWKKQALEIVFIRYNHILYSNSGVACLQNERKSHYGIISSLQGLGSLDLFWGYINYQTISLMVFLNHTFFEVYNWMLFFGNLQFNMNWTQFLHFWYFLMSSIILLTWNTFIISSLRCLSL